MIVQEDVLQYISEKQIVFYMHVMNSMNMNQSVYRHSDIILSYLQFSLSRDDKKNLIIKKL